MAGKRKAPARAPATSAPRGRPRRNTHSAYASAPEDHVEEEPVIQDQAPAPEAQQAPGSTPEQELQQLQAQLQSMQQERDRVAAAFAASQQVAQASAQAAEIRQQLALLQAEIQSMQPSQPPPVHLAKYIL
jgi:molecular chaperone GrpE (heat shock protein)